MVRCGLHLVFSKAQYSIRYFVFYIHSVCNLELKQFQLTHIRKDYYFPQVIL